VPQPLDYSYIPQYGVEPFVDSVDGGALLTGDNLLVSLWTAEDKGGEAPDPYVLFNTIIRPSSTNSDEEENLRSAYEKAFHSRCSAKFFFAPGGDATWPVCAALNPPDEYKQQLANAVRYIGDGASDPADLDNYEVLKSLQACSGWQLPNINRADSSLNYLSALSVEAMFSQYIPLAPVGVTTTRIMPLLRTSGADGQAPEFFDTSTVAGVQNMIAAVNRGDFYVAAFLGATDAEALSSYCEIRWPHSAARG
jgi:hypothetical protein